MKRGDPWRVVRAGLLLALAAAGASCQKQEPAAQLLLPTTTVVATNEWRGIVTADSLRVRFQPSVRAKVLSYLRRGEVVEVLQRGTDQERIAGAVAYWFEVSYQGVRGWVFGSHLDLIDPGAGADEVRMLVRATRTSNN